MFKPGLRVQKLGDAVEMEKPKRSWVIMCVTSPSVLQADGVGGEEDERTT